MILDFPFSNRTGTSSSNLPLAGRIRGVAAAAAAGQRARIRIKVNNLVDPGIVEELYRASQAGAEIDLIVAGGIYLSAHMPQHVPLGPAVALLVLSALLMAYNIYSLTRVKDFPWDRFFAVAKWSLLAYLVIAGLIEYAFLHNHLRGGPLEAKEGGRVWRASRMSC